MTNNLRSAAQSLVDAWQIGNGGIGWRVSLLRAALAESVAAPQDATDWEGIAADQAMTIGLMKVDYQQLSDLCTRQGIALMEQEEDAAKYRWLLRLFVYLGDSPAETLDAAIVKTMAKMPLKDV